MAPIKFKDLLINLEFNEISFEAWMAVAIIEDPITSETSQVAVPQVHRTRKDAEDGVLAVARSRIKQNCWRN